VAVEQVLDAEGNPVRGADGRRVWKSAPGVSREEREGWVQAELQRWEAIGASDDANDLEPHLGPLVDRLVMEEGLGPLTVGSRAALLHECWRSARDGLIRRLRNAGGDYSPDTVAARFPEVVLPKAPAKPDALPLMELFEQWAQHPENANLAPATRKRYRSAFRALAYALPNADVRTLTGQELTGYFDKQMTEGHLSPRVARDVHRAAFMSVFGWATGRHLIPSNPTAQATLIKVHHVPQVRHKEASDAEAREFLKAALAIPADAGTRSLEAAERWCAILLMYTGCRIGKLTQLRVQDVRADGDGWSLWITPEAGRVKSNQPREVPLHRRVIELGFVDYVKSTKDGALFTDPASRRHRGAQTPQSELVAAKIAAWARKVGLGDPMLTRPLHALRHRFITQARSAGIDHEYIEAIVGHARKTMNSRYGAYELPVLRRELDKLEPSKVEGMGKSDDA
jgi:integrase